MNGQYVDLCNDVYLSYGLKTMWSNKSPGCTELKFVPKNQGCQSIPDVWVSSLRPDYDTDLCNPNANHTLD